MNKIFEHNPRVVTKVVSGLLGLVSMEIQGWAADAAPAIEKKPKWESSVTAGLTLTAGNTETLLGNVGLVSKRKWAHDDLALGADGTSGETTLPGTDESTKNAESVHGFAQYNRAFSERLFAYGRLDMLHDAIADVEFRLALSPGVGYYFMKNAKMDLTGEVGPGYIYEKLGSGSDDYMTMRLAERYNYKISDRARLWQAIEVLPQVDRFENFILNFELGVEAALTQKMVLRTFIVDTYDNEPAPSRKENDFKWVTGVAYKF